jgi:hypothetical protein
VAYGRPISRTIHAQASEAAAGTSKSWGRSQSDTPIEQSWLDTPLGYFEAMIKRMDANKNVKATAKAAKLRLRITEPSVPGHHSPRTRKPAQPKSVRIGAMWAPPNKNSRALELINF